MAQSADEERPLHAAFRNDVLTGLSQAQKTIPSRWLYDDRGSELFEEITQLEEYYPTRTEVGILKAHADEMAAFCGEHAVLIEYGAGASLKTEILLSALVSAELFVPIDIAGPFLNASAERIRARFPGLRVLPVVADFTKAFELPSDLSADRRRTGFFPGSTIGNLTPEGARTFLARMRRHAGPHGRAIVGIDLIKDLDVLHRAYDDSRGVTAEFNLNLLHRLNRELGGEVAVDQFAHKIQWNADEAAIEMHLESRIAQSISVAGQTFDFAAGETIHSESSRKYSFESFGVLAREADWRIETVWSDPKRLFAVVALSGA